MKVLLVEDDLISRGYIENLLANWGHACVSCTDGLAAWQLIESGEAPDILLLDWIMPEVDGMEICRRLSESGLGNEKYVIMISGINDRNEIAEILRTGADDYMTKPIHEYEFLARLNVAERVLRYQESLRTRTQELEETVRRYVRMGELEGQKLVPDELETSPQAQEAYAEAVEEAQSDATALGPDGSALGEADETASEGEVTNVVQPLPEKVSKLAAVRAYHDMLTGAFESYGLSPVISNEPKDLFGEERYISWVSLLLLKRELWLDLVLEVPASTAAWIGERLYEQEAVTGEDLMDFFAQFANLLHGGFRSALNRELIASHVAQPPGSIYIPRDFAYEAGSKYGQRFGIDLDGNVLNGCLYAMEAVCVSRPISMVNEFSILAEAVSSKSHPDHMLARKWTVLRGDALASLKDLHSNDQIDGYLPAIAPSAVISNLAAWEGVESSDQIAVAES